MWLIDLIDFIELKPGRTTGSSPQTIPFHPDMPGPNPIIWVRLKHVCAQETQLLCHGQRTGETEGAPIPEARTTAMN